MHESVRSLRRVLLDLKVLGVAAALLLAVLLVAVLFAARQARYYQDDIGSALERQLGFRHGSPHLVIGEESIEFFTLHPEPGSAFAAAGVHDGDIVLSHSITGFYRALDEHRGSRITFSVTDGGDGVPIAQRPVRTITLGVPAQAATPMTAESR